MCDYSLHNVTSRPAKVDDRLVSTKFSCSTTRGFAAVGEPNVAVCLLPGTEVAFEREVEYERGWGILRKHTIPQKEARFRQVDNENQGVHHDALEFPNGQIVLVHNLREGQHVTVLQLPASSRTANAEAERTLKFARFLMRLLAIELARLCKGEVAEKKDVWTDDRPPVKAIEQRSLFVAKRGR